jgi:hypothetical protein
MDAYNGNSGQTSINAVMSVNIAANSDKTWTLDAVGNWSAAVRPTYGISNLGRANRLAQPNSPPAHSKVALLPPAVSPIRRELIAASHS